MIHPNEYLGAGQGLAVPTKIIKQADVVMMLNLFRTRFSAKIKKANWEYYEPRTEHGSSLSACAYAMVATEFGNLDFAYKYFLKTAKIDLEAKYKVYVGSVFMGGSHPAANGGAWMTAVLGFGGVQADEKRVAINPRLCAEMEAPAVSSRLQGGRFPDEHHENLGDDRLLGDECSDTRTILVAGKPVKCIPGKLVTSQISAGEIASVPQGQVLAIEHPPLMTPSILLASARPLVRCLRVRGVGESRCRYALDHL